MKRDEVANEVIQVERHRDLGPCPVCQGDPKVAYENRLARGDYETLDYAYQQLEKDYRQTKLCLWQLIKGQEEHGTYTPEQWLTAVKAIVLGDDDEHDAFRPRWITPMGEAGG